jgi:hypothetical protein
VICCVLRQTYPDLFVRINFTQGHNLHERFVFGRVAAGTREDDNGVGIARMVDESNERRHRDAQ